MRFQIKIKTMALLITALFFVSLLVSCGKNKEDVHVFRGHITAIENGSMLVTPAEGSEELKSSDSFQIAIRDMPPSPEPEAGDTVEITYSGGIQETYPAGLDNVISITVVEKASKPAAESAGKAEDADTGNTVTIESCIPEKSILWFRDDPDAAKLMADMNDGKIPSMCNVLYDEMGSRPEVTVTDPETITDLYNRLALMSVGEKSEMSITDSYHHIRFTLQDGTNVGWSFEGTELLCVGTENYEVKDEGNLWVQVRWLQEAEMGYEEVTNDSQSEAHAGMTAAAGPYGQISLQVPDNWSAQAVDVDEEGLMYGLYGLVLKPDTAAGSGQIEVFCTNSFGVCGTGLVEEEITLAGGKAAVGPYDGHEHWDFIVFGELKPSVVAQHTECDSWTADMWDEAMRILDTVRFDPSITEGGIGEYIPESENDEIAVSMDVYHVTPSGLTVRFRQYDSRETGELTYGEGYLLEKKSGNTWEAVPMIIENGAFTDEGYTIPPEGEAEMETDWEWLYGKLTPGTYRINKTVITTNSTEDGYKTYSLYAQFFLS